MPHLIYIPFIIHYPTEHQCSPQPSSSISHSQSLSVILFLLLMRSLKPCIYSIHWPLSSTGNKRLRSSLCLYQMWPCFPFLPSLALVYWLDSITEWSGLIWAKREPHSVVCSGFFDKWCSQCNSSGLCQWRLWVSNRWTNNGLND